MKVVNALAADLNTHKLHKATVGAAERWVETVLGFYSLLFIALIIQQFRNMSKLTLRKEGKPSP